MSESAIKVIKRVSVVLSMFVIIGVILAIGAIGSLFGILGEFIACAIIAVCIPVGIPAYALYGVDFIFELVDKIFKR